MIVSFKCMFKANNAYYGYLKGKTYLSVATQTQESIVVHNEKWKASTSRICTRWPLLLALAIQSISVLYELLYLCFVNVRESQRRQNSQEKYKQKKWFVVEESSYVCTTFNFFRNRGNVGIRNSGKWRTDLGQSSENQEVTESLKSAFKTT